MSDTLSILKRHVHCQFCMSGGPQTPCIRHYDLSASCLVMLAQGTGAYKQRGVAREEVAFGILKCNAPFRDHQSTMHDLEIQLYQCRYRA